MASNNSGKPPTNASSTGIIGSLINAVKGATNATKKAVTNTASTVKNAISPPVNTIPHNNTLKFKNPGAQTGGTAPLNYRYSLGQPSDKVMDWATTAGIPLQKGGKRRTYKGGKRVKRRTIKRSYKRNK